MCMNCGCGELSKRHQDSDITKEDLEKAARGGGKSVDEVASNMRAALDKMGSSQRGQQGMTSPR